MVYDYSNLDHINAIIWRRTIAPEAANDAKSNEEHGEGGQTQNHASGDIVQW